MKIYLSFFTVLFLSCSSLTFSKKWPKEVIGYSLKENQTKKNQEEQLVYEKENQKIQIQIFSFKDPMEALGLFFNLRAKHEKTFSFTNEKIRSGFISRNLVHAAIWYNQETYFFESSEKLNRESWQSFLTQFTKNWPRGISRPQVFQIFLSEKAQIDKLIYKPPFFISPYIFQNDIIGELKVQFFNSNLDALNTLTALSYQEGFFGESLSNYTVVVGEKEIATHFENSLISLSLPLKDSRSLKEEFRKILNQLPQ